MRYSIKPLHSFVLVERDDDKRITDGGILLPDLSRRKSEQGIVTELGSGKPLADGTFAPFQVEVGDRVLFMAHNGLEAMIDGVKTFMISESNIIAILTEE